MATFEESWIFRHPKRPFWIPAAPKRDMMWYEILRPSFFRTLRIIYPHHRRWLEKKNASTYYTPQIYRYQVSQRCNNNLAGKAKARLMRCLIRCQFDEEMQIFFFDKVYFLFRQSIYTFSRRSCQEWNLFCRKRNKFLSQTDFFCHRRNKFCHEWNNFVNSEINFCTNEFFFVINEFYFVRNEICSCTYDIFLSILK